MFKGSRGSKSSKGLVLALVVVGVCTFPSVADSQGVGPTVAADGRVEDIYVARSIRESQIKPSDFCAPASIGFGNAISEDRYTFQSTATRASDGLLVDNNINTIGSLRACFGSTADPLLLKFYAVGVLAGVTFTGSGECLTAKQDYPEPGLVVARCFLELRNLSNGYIGGQLTTNTMRSRKVTGVTTDPPGYTQPSIATVRLWRRRG